MRFGPGISHHSDDFKDQTLWRKRMIWRDVQKQADLDGTCTDGGRRCGRHDLRGLNEAAAHSAEKCQVAIGCANGTAARQGPDLMIMISISITALN